MSSTKGEHPSVKEAVTRLVQELPESASWDDLMYEIMVMRKIEAGLEDFQEGRTHSHAEIRREFGLA